MNYRKFENMRLCQIHYTKHECLLVKPLHENTKAKNNHEIKTRQKLQKKKLHFVSLLDETIRPKNTTNIKTT